MTCIRSCCDDNHPGVLPLDQREPLLLFRRQWNHEPTPNPFREGNGQDPEERLLPSWEGSGVGWFLDQAVFPDRLGTVPEMGH